METISKQTASELRDSKPAVPTIHQHRYREIPTSNVICRASQWRETHHPYNRFPW